ELPDRVHSQELALIVDRLDIYFGLTRDDPRGGLPGVADCDGDHLRTAIQFASRPGRNRETMLAFAPLLETPRRLDRLGERGARHRIPIDLRRIRFFSGPRRVCPNRP